jgi:hypothetical protein
LSLCLNLAARSQMLPFGGTDPSWVVCSMGKITNPRFGKIVRNHCQMKRYEWALFFMLNSNVNVPFEVIERFAIVNDINLSQSVQIHDELVEYLDLVSQSKKRISPNLLVDEAWHSFVLHTEQYQIFCSTRFGRFIHHCPFSNEPNPEAILVRKLIEKRELAFVLATCNDGTGDGACSGKCGQSKCDG